MKIASLKNEDATFNIVTLGLFQLPSPVSR